MNNTTNEIKNFNKSQVYRLIYENNGITKQSIAYHLHISLPTITKCLNALMSEGKIICSSSKASTGGRPAVLYHFNETARIAIGVEVLADRLNTAVVNLIGDVIKEESIEISFLDSESYFSIYRNVLSRVIDSLHVGKSTVLGITICMQGIVAPDGEHVFFGKLLNSTSFTRSSFSKGISYPISLVHDAEVAALAELWSLQQIQTGIFISLNTYVGTAVIIGGQVIHTENLSSGAYEHMILHPNGDICYCGKKGCADAYISANSIKRSSRENLEVFFENKAAGARMETEIWDEYLKDLASFIDNARMVICGDIILSGTLSKYLSRSDFENIRSYIESTTTFRNLNYHIYKGRFGEKAALIGAALTRIQTYLRSEGLKSDIFIPGASDRYTVPQSLQ